MPALQFSYDVERDVLTVEGNKFAGHFFRFFQAPNIGKAFVLEKLEAGEVIIRVLDMFPLTLDSGVTH
jgi:hypothetical protein